MTSLQNELKACFHSARTGQDGTLFFEFTYPATFTGFQGHFPDDPILPGVCLLQSLRVGLEQAWSVPLRLAEISNAKFIAPTRPGEKLAFNVTVAARQNGLLTLKAKVTRNQERIAELSAKLEETIPQ